MRSVYKMTITKIQLITIWVNFTKKINSCINQAFSSNLKLTAYILFPLQKIRGGGGSAYKTSKQSSVLQLVAVSSSINVFVLHLEWDKQLHTTL